MSMNSGKKLVCAACLALGALLFSLPAQASTPRSASKSSTAKTPKADELRRLFPTPDLAVPNDVRCVTHKDAGATCCAWSGDTFLGCVSVDVT
jgi:hypothetical protein